MHVREAKQIVEKIRCEVLVKRTETRQVQSLLEAVLTEEAVESKRASQLALDEWHRFRRLEALSTSVRYPPSIDPPRSAEESRK